MQYKKIIIACNNNAEAENISDALFALDALSVTFADAADEPIFQIRPDDAPLWKNTKIIALFPDDIDAEKIMALLKISLGFPSLEFKSEILPDEDWVRKTQSEFPTQFYGENLCVQTTWRKNPEFPGAILTIDPGLAFGTGTHPTTSLCLSWLAENDIKNKIIIDYGCGSGILALAALALGAKKVYATDHDPQALLATENNAKLNSFVNEDNLEIFTIHPLKHKADIVLANILANPLIELSETLRSLVKPNGYLILSGILMHEADKVFSAYQAHFEKINLTEKENWCRLVLQGRGDKSC